MVTKVILSDRLKKALQKLPRYIVLKLQDWVEDVEERGLEIVRQTPAYHDEPLKGQLKGMRSMRLSRAYRAYYLVVKDKIEFVRVERVDKHEY
jgi:proteic killer suppression protein